MDAMTSSTDAHRPEMLTGRHAPQPIRSLMTVLLTCASLLLLLAGCGLHNGGEELAFLRGDQLWTIQSDGSSPTAVTQANVAGFAWSPDHHQLVFRYGSTVATLPQPPGASTLGLPDTPGNLAILSVNGGYALQITPQQAGSIRSDPWWDANGNRLVYREGLVASPQPPTYIVSQADQPVGIARKAALETTTFPAITPDGTRLAVLAPTGAVLIEAPGQSGTTLAQGALLTLPGTGRPARILWQPGHDAVLYAVADPGGVALRLTDLHDGTRTIATTPALLDVAFSPDGSLILVRTPAAFELWSVAHPGAPLYSWPEADPLALPWWSPNGHSLLVQDATGWTLVNVAKRSAKPLVRYPAPIVAGNAVTSWNTTSNSPWSPDGTHFAFVAPAGSTWLGRTLPAPRSAATGLYVAAAGASASSLPALFDSGPDRAPSWSALDPATTFLVPS
jgi:hypothetical protein